MALIELPHTSGCLVCGRDNPKGLHLHLSVDPETAVVTTEFTPSSQLIGFDGIVHGGIIATVVDEAMVWSATWRARRFCVCGELTVRFRNSARVGQQLRIEAEVEYSRPKLIQTVAKVFDNSNALLATASGKYVPVMPDQHQTIVGTLIDEPSTAQAAAYLKRGT